MNIVQKIAALLGVTALAVALLWLVFVLPRAERIAPGYEGIFSYMARSSVAEAPEEPLVTESFIEHYHERLVRGEGDFILLEMVTEFFEVVTERLLFYTADQLQMNRTSRLMEGTDVLVLFPPKLQKRDYVIRRFPYFPKEGVLFTFEGEEKVRGLRSFRFSFHIASVDWSANYSHLVLPEGVSVLARDWGTVWVEPRTGIMMKHEEQWEARISGGNFHGHPVDVGEMWFLPDTVILQVFLAGNEGRRLRLYSWIAPGMLLLTGGILLCMAKPSRKGRLS